MPTNNPRVNITFEPQWRLLLSELAKVEGKSISGMAKELVLEALELREDIALSSIAKAREGKPGRRISHKDAWQ
jgi:hypothetical protein